MNFEYVRLFFLFIDKNLHVTPMSKTDILQI